MGCKIQILEIRLIIKIMHIVAHRFLKSETNFLFVLCYDMLRHASFLNPLIANLFYVFEIFCGHLTFAL